MNPLVSVCIPAFEQPAPLRRALESVLSQDYPSFEIIVTDDSRDNSVCECIKNILPDSRIIYKKNEKVKGTPGNWNEAVRLAQGDLIKILHHDDWLTGNDSLGRFAQLLIDRPGCDLAFSATSVCDPAGKQKRVHCPAQSKVRKIAQDPKTLVWANMIGCPSSVIFRRSAFAPFDVRLQWLVDVEFYLSILAKNRNFSFSPQVLVATTDGSSKQVTFSSATKEVRIREWLALYKQWKPRSRFRDLNDFLKLLRNAGPEIISDVLKPETGTLPLLLRCGIQYETLRYSLKLFRRRLYSPKLIL